MPGEKYAVKRTEIRKARGATEKHCAVSSVVLKCVTREGEVYCWYKRKLRGLEKAG